MKYKTIQFTLTFLIIIALVWQVVPSAAQAVDFEIKSVQMKELVNDKLTIAWSTNEPAQGWLMVGNELNQFPLSVHANTFENYHEATISLPKEKTTYQYKVIAENQAGERIISFAFSIKVDKFTDTKNPEFVAVPSLLYSDNTRAYIIWQTNEHTKGVLTYSPYADLSQSKTVTGSTEKNKNYQARVQINKLLANTTYYYELTISDDAKNTSQTAILNFTTKSEVDSQPLRFLNLIPLSNNDSHITDTKIHSSWTTSRPAICEFFYGEKNKGKKKIAETGFEIWDHTFTAEGLLPNTEYQYTISCRDVLGQKQTTENILFRTRTPLVLGYEYQPGVQKFYGQNYQLVKSVSGKTVYAIVNKQKYAIKSPKIFTQYGFSWSEIKTISQKELDKYPDAKLVKTPDSPAVYFLYHSIKRKKVLLTENVFKSYRNNAFNKVITVSSDDLNAYNDIVLVKEENKPTIYLLQNATKRPIANMTALKNNGLSDQPIGIVSQKDLEAYQTATTIE